MSGLKEDLEKLRGSLKHLSKYKLANENYLQDLYAAQNEVRGLIKKLDENQNIVYNDSEFVRQLYFFIDYIKPKLSSIGNSIYDQKGKIISKAAEAEAEAIRKKVYGPDLARKQLEGKEIAKREKNPLTMSILIILVSALFLSLAFSIPVTGEFLKLRNSNHGLTLFLLIFLCICILYTGFKIKNLRK